MEFKTNTLVTSADVKAHTLTTESGDTISYEKLIVATGTGVRKLTLTLPSSSQRPVALTSARSRRLM